jgi:hypothetical protein
MVRTGKRLTALQIATFGRLGSSRLLQSAICRFDTANKGHEDHAGRLRGI